MPTFKGLGEVGKAWRMRRWRSEWEGRGIFGEGRDEKVLDC